MIFPEDDLEFEKFKSRFLKYVEKTNNCWEWKGWKNHKGYGRFRIGGKKYFVHRISFELFKGKIPNGLLIDHLCRNRGCVNPDHLEAVTLRENWDRGFAPSSIASKRTHCKKGHKFTPQNTYYYPNHNERRCIMCTKSYQEQYRKRKDLN